MRHYIGYLLIFGAASQWSLVGPLCLYCLKAGMSPIDIAFWRTSIGGSLFCLHAALSGGLHVHGVRDGLSFFLFGAVCIGGMFSLYPAAVEEGGAALASILLYTAPVWVAVTSRIFFSEALTRWKLLAIACSLAGVVCISLSGGDGIQNFSPVAILLGLGSGLLYSGHYIFVKRRLERYSPFAVYGYSMLAAAVVCLPFTNLDILLAVEVWQPLLAVSALCSYFSYWLYCEGLKLVEASRAVIIATAEPMLAIFVAWWWLGELFFPLGWVGTGLVMAAVVLILVDGNRAALDMSDGLQ